MKSTPLIALATALAGFLGGWLAKPTAVQAPVASQPVPPPARTPVPPRPAPDVPVLPPGERPPLQSGQPQVPATPTAPAAAAGMDEAKMARLVELLGLDEAAQDKLRQILADSRRPFTNPGKALSSKETLDLVAKAATELDQSLKALFTPEQAATFAALRQRERDNRIEAKAQRDLGRLTEVTDLTPAQRDRILEKLRANHLADLEKLPPAASLMVETSVLPLGSHALPEQSIIALTRTAEVDSGDDHAAAHDRMIEQQRRQLDEQLAFLRTVLSPAQVAQFEAAAAQQRAFQDMIRQPPR